MQPPESDKYSDSTVFMVVKSLYYLNHVIFNKFQYLQIFGFLDLVILIDIIYVSCNSGPFVINNDVVDHKRGK